MSTTDPHPELLVERAGDEAALVQHQRPLEGAVGLLPLQVRLPVLELASLQRLHVEVRTLNLGQTKLGVKYLIFLLQTKLLNEKKKRK